jgi:DAK2 domain fusion protein YloV
VLDVLDASAIREWSAAASTAISLHQESIDELNVFPVADRDTGTNLAMTLRSAAAAVDRDPSLDAGGVLRAMAGGAAVGARGNSGLILAQILRGMSDVVTGGDSIDSHRLKRVLRGGAESAYAAVLRPVEGTILTVARAAALAGEKAEETLASVICAGLDGARAALERTTGQLDALRRANVVDAGGRGFVVVLDALRAVVTGVACAAPPKVDHGSAGRVMERADVRPVRWSNVSVWGSAYEVQYLLRSTPEAVEELITTLDRLGDSLVVANVEESLWNVHIHVAANDIGAAIETGIGAGRPSEISVTRFADQYSNHGEATPADSVAILVAASGEGIAEIFRAEGVFVLDPAPASEAVPGAGEILAAIRGTGARAVIVLADAKSDPTADGEQSLSGASLQSAVKAAREEGTVVAVIPIHSPVQALAAVAVHDPGRRFEDNVINLAETAAATRWAQISIAEGEALTIVGRCQAGDIIGLVGGEVVTIGASVESVAETVIDLLLGVGGELVTVLLGAGVEAGTETALAAHLSAVAAHAGVVFYQGGQAGHPLLIGVE